MNNPNYSPEAAQREIARDAHRLGPLTITIGMQYTDRQKRVHTVADIWKTYNAAGELVQTRYVCTHEFCGQTVTERDVVAVTIQRNLANA